MGFKVKVPKSQVRYWLSQEKSKKSKKKNSRQKRKSSSSKKELRLKILSILAVLCLIGVVFGFITVVGVIAYFSKDLPSPDRLSQREVAQTTKIFARNGELLYEIYADEKRTLVQLDDVPQHLIDATLAAEDADFYTHPGFDLKGILYGAYKVVFEGKIQSGSTISQQLVKTVFLTPEQKISRKIKEIILSLEIERRFTKDEILQMYLNEVPYGGLAYGVGSASEMYFGKHVRDVSLAEASLLAGLPQSPTFYSPYGAYPENAKARQEYVLSLMVHHGFLTAEEASEVKAEPLNFLPNNAEMKAPHFVMFVKEQLVQEFGEQVVEKGGLRVWTTLDMGLQTIAEEEVGFQLDRLAQVNALAGNAGLVAANPKTGEILAMVGSRDYFDLENDGNVNVTVAERQPGSSMKPIMYLTAFEQGYTPATFLSDIRTCWDDNDGQFCPLESDGKYWGPLLLRDALANSRNVPAVKMLQMVGVDNTLDMAHRLGITSLNEPERYGLSLTLGGGEVKLVDMVQAYSVFANMGEKVDLTPISRVEDSSGKLIKNAQHKGTQVVDEEYVYLLNSILSDNKARQRLFGAYSKLEIGRPAGVKTGTTNDNRDAWCVGYTPQLVAGVWVGNNDNSKMAQTIQGSTGATPIWHYFMKRSLDGQSVEEWSKPSDIIEVRVDNLSGLLPQEGQDFSTRREIFVKGTQPTKIDDFHLTVSVCKGEDLLATDFHKAFGLAEEKTYLKLTEINPDWQSYTEKWMKGNDDYIPLPTGNCPIKLNGQKAEAPIIEITSPEDGANLKVYGFEVSANIYSNSTVTKVEFYWDDLLVEELTSVPYSIEYNLSMNEQGEHTITVRAYDSEGDENQAEIKVKLPIKQLPSPTATPLVTVVISPSPEITVMEID